MSESITAAASPGGGGGGSIPVGSESSHAANASAAVIRNAQRVVLISVLSPARLEKGPSYGHLQLKAGVCRFDERLVAVLSRSTDIPATPRLCSAARTQSQRRITAAM